MRATRKPAAPARNAPAACSYRPNPPANAPPPSPDNVHKPVETSSRCPAPKVAPAQAPPPPIPQRQITASLAANPPANPASSTARPSKLTSAISAHQLRRILGPGGFDPARDILEITVNRWPHGYAYEYNSLFDEFWLNGTETPCELARKPFGRLAIANADAGAYAYTDCAIDHAYRAVQELKES